MLPIGSGIRTKVFVVEDTPYGLEATRSILNDAADLEYVGYATNFADALEYLQQEKSRIVVVLDLRLEEPRPTGSTQPPRTSEEEGFRLLEEISRLKPGLPVVVLTYHAHSENIQRAFLLGALAVLDKEKCAAIDLQTAIRQALHSYVTLHLDHLGSLMAPRSDSLLQLLTPTERAVLELVAAGKQSGEIAVATNTSPHTVKSHFRNIRRKLNVRRTYDAAIKVGLVRPPRLDEEDDE
jgi:DNA-binding NarL/FixJ family response regulator